MHAHQLWSTWQALILHVAVGFTHPGQGLFVEWVTGLALNVQAHTLAQFLIGLDRVQDWKALERFAEPQGCFLFASLVLVPFEGREPPARVDGLAFVPQFFVIPCGRGQDRGVLRLACQEQFERRMPGSDPGAGRSRETGTR